MDIIHLIDFFVPLGAAIRFSPQKDWPENSGAPDALAALEPIKEAFPEVSYADLIVLAGITAVEAAGGTLNSFFFMVTYSLVFLSCSNFQHSCFS